MGEPWFGAKTYGVGVGPKGRAGWISVAIYLALMIVTPTAGAALRWPLWAVPVALAVFTVGFLVLIALKSSKEPMRWRWGGR